jgi:[protein-PII] uridylyltransferase
MQPARFELVEDRRAVIDRRALAERIAAVPKGDSAAISAILGKALAAGRAEIARRFAVEPARGRMAAASYAFLADQLLRLAFDSAASHLVPESAAQAGIALVGLGGTGRGEMAPFSDIDLLFLVADPKDAATGKLVEATLYLLWDLSWKVGHAVRDSDEVIALAREDVSIRTAFLEARWIWGDETLFTSCAARFRKEIVAGSGAEFVAAKLAERDARHRRMGDSRYVVEPNVKDGKGGLRDLHTLYWIGKYLYGVPGPSGWSTPAC